MTRDAQRVLEAIAWFERTGASARLPLQRIATAALGGDAEGAARVLAQLGGHGYIRGGPRGWDGGSLTPRGRDRAADGILGEHAESPPGFLLALSSRRY